MKKRFLLCFGILLLSAMNVWSQLPSTIPLLPMYGDSIIRPTSLIQDDVPIATLDGTELIIEFDSSTP